MARNKESTLKKLTVDGLRGLAESYSIRLPSKATKSDILETMARKVEGLSLEEVERKIERVKKSMDLPVEARKLRRRIAELKAKITSYEEENRLLADMVNVRARALEAAEARIRDLEESVEHEPTANETIPAEKTERYDPEKKPPNGNNLK